jgi:hypothetical protein
MDKEVDSRKVEDHKFHARREESSSVVDINITHQDTQFAREEVIPILSPIRQHKRRTGVDELQGELRRSNLLLLMVSTRRMNMQRHGCWA